LAEEKSVDRFGVLDDGFVKLVDVMGDQFRILEAARVSTGAPAVKGMEKDQGLINYLWENGHTSPFEHVSFTFQVKAPIFIARQWMRHRTGKYNEMSARYREVPLEFYIPDSFRKQDAKNKQKSFGEHRHSQTFKDQYVAHCWEGLKLYQEMVENGAAREQARMVLPQSMYTEFFFTVDLHNLLKFLEKRFDVGAQAEFREYAFGILQILKSQNGFAYLSKIIKGVEGEKTLL
jgi:thymidylate synthase (FAD)